MQHSVLLIHFCLYLYVFFWISFFRFLIFFLSTTANSFQAGTKKASQAYGL